MSLQFSDTTNYRGIIQIYEKELGFNQGDVSGDTNRLKAATADINLALDDFTDIAIKSSGLWQFDDSNQTDYPIITTNIVSGQRDYAFTTDGSGNLILDIYRVVIGDPSGVFRDITPVDQQTPNNNGNYTSTFINGQNATGTPKGYDKTSNALFFDVIPNYNLTNGIKFFINRESSYFIYTDTTKKPGIPGLFHKYLALRAALDYARRNSLSVFPNLEAEVYRYEGNERLGINGSISSYFGNRSRDVRKRLLPNVEDCH